MHVGSENIIGNGRKTWNRLGSGRQNDVSKELNSSFSFDEKAKKYNDLNETKKIEFYTKDNGDIHITLLDSNSNLVNKFTVFLKKI